MKKRVTIKEVAKEAGVSIATISYVLNGKDNLSKETVEKVNRAIEKLNYIPNLSARSLVNNKSNLVGVVIPQTEPGKQLMFNNPFYSEFLSGVEYAARCKDYQIILTGENIDRNYIDISLRRNLDGIIVIGMYSDSFYNDLKKTRLPIVLVDSYTNDHYYHSVQINDRYGGYIATNYLLSKGHKKIGLVTGTIKKDGVSEKRYNGYRDALKEAGIKYKDEYIFEGLVDYEYGLNSASDILKKDVTALFVTADIMAIGLIQRLKELGKRVPDDISIIGFDDIYLNKFINPRLTTVKQEIYLKGVTAVDMLLDCINGEKSGKQEVILPIEVLERQTVKELTDS